MEYVVSKEVCEKLIAEGGKVCEGCGRELVAIETVDNSNRPTFWQGCEHCQCFRRGVDPIYFRVARQLVEDGTIIPYGHMCRKDYGKTPENLEYYFDSQTAGLSHIIKQIHLLIEGKP